MLTCAAGPKDDLEESGWKMVSGDVFRTPRDAVALCVQVGSGVQIISSATLTLFFAALGKPLKTSVTGSSFQPLWQIGSASNQTAGTAPILVQAR